MTGRLVDQLCQIYDRNLALEGQLIGDADWLDLDDLLIPNLVADTARHTTGAIATIDLVLDNREDVLAIVLSGVTARLDARVRFSYFRDAAGTVLLPDAPTPAWRYNWGRVAATAAMSWSDANAWTGRPTERSMRGKKRHIVDLLTRQVRPRRVRIEIDNRGQPFDGGHLFVGAPFRPEWGHNFGRTVDPKLTSQVDRTPAGGRIVRSGQAYRGLTLEFADLTRAEAGRFEDLSLALDLTAPLLALPVPRAGLELWRDIWLGFLGKGTATREQQDELWTGTLDIEEMG